MVGDDLLDCTGRLEPLFDRLLGFVTGQPRIGKEFPYLLFAPIKLGLNNFPGLIVLLAFEEVFLVEDPLVAAA